MIEALGSWFARPELAPLAALVAVPLVIHLLFRLRYRRVKWPAMEFLLQSRRKTRRRTRLEQLLLLSLRCALALGVVAAVARPIVGEDFAALLESGPRSEHVVVLDDTLSMGETSAGESAYRRGVRYFLKLADRLAEQPNRHALTAISSATGAVRFGPESPNAEIAAELRRRFADPEPSSIGNKPDDALESALARLTASAAVHRVLHVVGDFRERDFHAQSGALAALKKAAQAGVRIRLIACATGAESSANLTLESLRLSRPPTAVGVPLRFEATVRNHGRRKESNVPLAVRLDGKPGPTTIVPSIAPGRTATAFFEMQATAAGVHEVQAEAPADPLLGDNVRFAAFDATPSAPILLIDGDDRQRDARLAAVALAPGGTARTGWQPTIRGPDALRAGGLEKYSAVWLLNVPSVGDVEATALQRYVAQGGGLATFVGDAVRSAGYEPLSKAGLSPATPVAAAAFDRAEDEKRPDLKPSNHPVVRSLAGARNPFAESVRVAKRMTVAEKLAEDAEVLLRLRDDSPLLVVGKHGAGRTALTLTTVGPGWNNWPRNPSYVVFLLELQAWLAGPPATLETAVGETFAKRIDLAAYRRSATWQTPASAGGAGSRHTLEATVEGGFGRLRAPAASAPGVHRLTIVEHAGKSAVLPVAVNVDPEEGALVVAPRTRFEEALGASNFTMIAADEEVAEEARGLELRDWLPILLAGLLLAEQLWARRCSHRSAAS